MSWDSLVTMWCYCVLTLCHFVKLSSHLFYFELIEVLYFILFFLSDVSDVYFQRHIWLKMFFGIPLKIMECQKTSLFRPSMNTVEKLFFFLAVFFSSFLSGLLLRRTSGGIAAESTWGLYGGHGYVSFSRNTFSTDYPLSSNLSHLTSQLILNLTSLEVKPLTSQLVRDFQFQCKSTWIYHWIIIRSM